MVIVYHIGEPRKVEKKVKVNVCDVKYVNSRGKSVTKETRCDKNGRPYAKGYRNTWAKDVDEAKARMLRKQDRDYEVHRLWAEQKDQPNAKSLADIRHEYRRTKGSKRRAAANS